MKNYTDEQKDLLEKPVIMIMPAFNGEWIIEVTTHDGELHGRFNAESGEVALQSLRTVLIGNDNPTGFGAN